MRNKKMTKRIVLSALVALTFGSVAAGTTYALFTSEATTNVAVSTGKVKVDTPLSNDSIQLSSLDSTTDETIELDKTARTFTNGGSFSYDDKTGAIILDKFTPGDKVEFTINAKNSSTVNIKYRTVLKVLSDNGLFQGLKVTINGEEYDGSTTYSKYESLTANTEFTTTEYKFSIELPTEAGNEYQEKSCQITFNIEAIQGNAAVTNPDQTVYQIYTPLDLAAFAKKANADTLTANKVILMNDIDMSGIKYVSPQLTKSIEFDGNSKTIKNFAPIQSKDASNNQFIGLIGKVGSSEGVHVHDITFDKAEVKGDFTVQGDQYLGGAAVVGMIDSGTTSEVKLENIKFTNGIHVSGVKYAGSVVGYTSGTTTTINSISIEGESTFAGYTAGGIIGQVGGGKATITTISGKNISVDGHSKEGGIAGAVSGATLDITYEEKDYTSTISNEAEKNSGNIVGLSINTTSTAVTSNTTVNGYPYFSISKDEELQKLKINDADKTKLNIIEIGKGTYNGYSASLTNVTGGVKVVGRGNKDDIIWIQAKEGGDGNHPSGFSFSGTAVQMENLTLTSDANNIEYYISGFPHATSTSFDSVKILVKHENGAMGLWGEKATFNKCLFVTQNHAPESNVFTYGGSEYNFISCTFTSEETAIKMYQSQQASSKEVTINVKTCVFDNNHDTSSGNTLKTYKAAIQLSMDKPKEDLNHYTVNIDGFGEGKSKLNDNYGVGSLSSPYVGLLGFRQEKTSYYKENVTLKVNEQEVDLGLSSKTNS